MKKIKVKVPAKLNLTLDILGVSDGFHSLQSLVCSVDLYDTVTVKSRADGDITLKSKGIDPECITENNNAYKTALLFKGEQSTSGVDIIIDKRIPVGGGLGGSSADVVGVLKGMNALFGVNADLKDLADRLGSDTGYMLNGGWAVISGRGERVNYQTVDKRLFFIIIPESQGVSAKDSYRKFDLMKKKYPPCTEKALSALTSGDMKTFFGLAKNDLTAGSVAVLESIDFNIKALYKAGAPLAVMTGSGSAVVGVFDSKRERNKAFRKLKATYKTGLIKAKSI
ncbi:MAG: 4-(cytidine 5'-diphospho)-2-C-methyl-D-erythritol kinase [Clostridia bacterium]|nr:4-(cytidine 5'-diphospho)-2-C-methyl-D-erythritol kinase [Clostridia bacterium]